MNQIPLAERIRAERCRGGYTQEELARRLGVTKAAVSKWECGQSAPDIALLPKLASLFSIMLDELLGLRNEPPGGCGSSGGFAATVSRRSRDCAPCATRGRARRRCLLLKA